MSYPTKIIMYWDVLPGSEAEYSEFIVNEFIPRLNRLGIGDLEFWYTGYGEHEQIMASGITPTREQMERILSSEEWESLEDRLTDLSVNLRHKMIKADGYKFQI